MARRSRDSRSLSLSFRQVECRCGATRLFAQNCSCGRQPPPTEVDDDLNRRRRLVAFIERRCDEHARVAVTTLEDFCETASRGLEGFMPATNLALRGTLQEGFDEAATAFANLRSLSRSVDELTQLRPTRALRPAMTTTAAALSDVAQLLMSGLATGDISELQLVGRQLQPALDRGAAAASLMSQQLSDWHSAQAGENPAATLARLAAREAQSNQGPVKSILGLAHYGRGELERRLSLDDVPLDVGAHASIVSALSRLYFDQERFWSIVEWQVLHCRTNSTRLEQLAADAFWRESWFRVSVQAVAAGERMRVLMAAARDDERTVHAALDFCHDLQESVSKLVLATTKWTSNNNAAIIDLLAGGVTNLGQWLEAHGPRGAEVFRIPTRHAKAHNDWRIDSGDVVLCELKPPPGGAVRLTADELLDHLIELVEVTIGLHFGLVVAAALDGISLPDTELAVGHDWPAWCEAILVGGGWRDAQLSIVHDSVELTGSAGRLVAITELACLVPYIPSSTTRLEATVSTIKGTRHVTMALGPLREHALSEDGFTRGLLFADLMTQTVVDGVPLMTQRGFRKYIALAIGPWARESGDNAGAMRAFSAAREIAVSRGDSELDRCLRRVQGWRSTRLGGFERSLDDIGDFVDWMSFPAVSPTYEF